MLAVAVAGAAAVLTLLLGPAPADGHTWLFTSGRATRQASLAKPFRVRVDEAGQGTHAQMGPGNTMVVRWASSHNNTFSLAVVAASDQKWFFDKRFYWMLDDYIDAAPAGSNEAVSKPRYHGSASNLGYLSKGSTAGSFTASAGGYKIKDLFKRKLPTTDPNYVAHNLDMGGNRRKWSHNQYEYNPDFVHQEGVQGVGHWVYQPDRRVAYRSAKYPWLVAAYRFHNKVRILTFV